MRFLISVVAALGLALLLPALAAAQCQCQPSCTCQPGGTGHCGDPACPAAPASYCWMILADHPGHHGLFKGDVQVGERDPEGRYWQRYGPGKWADKASSPPLAFPLAQVRAQAVPAYQFAPAFLGGCAGGSCGGGR